MPAGRPSLRASGIKTKTDEHIDRIYEILYDFGPHTGAQIANLLGVSEDWARCILNLMRTDGTVTIMNRGLDKYWILKEDAKAA